ncbi:NUDIX hydrolase [Roseburia sp. 499]|uniref:NUDIX hydrolase n=1 Tax=Roseburia sp. 499 TaxID=1261634 RepID=UPI000A8F10E6
MLIKMSEVQVKFYEQIDDEKLKFAVIISKTGGKWVLCKHKERNTYEVPGGHREPGETILQTAKRELQEETGAIDFDIAPVCVYSVIGKTRVNENIDEESFGMLYFANIRTFEQELHSEIEKIIITDQLPKEWTYPLIQPKLMEKATELGFC